MHSCVVHLKRDTLIPKSSQVYVIITVKLQLCELMGTEIPIIGQPMIELQFDT